MLSGWCTTCSAPLRRRRCGRRMGGSDAECARPRVAHFVHCWAGAWSRPPACGSARARGAFAARRRVSDPRLLRGPGTRRVAMWCLTWRHTAPPWGAFVAALSLWGGQRSGCCRRRRFALWVCSTTPGMRLPRLRPGGSARGAAMRWRRDGNWRDLGELGRDWTTGSGQSLAKVDHCWSNSARFAQIWSIVCQHWATVGTRSNFSTMFGRRSGDLWTSLGLAGIAKVELSGGVAISLSTSCGLFSLPGPASTRPSASQGLRWHSHELKRRSVALSK